ncbi:MAG: YfcC family protein [Elusimicrobia bacterium]|nr:YfcC family protein [Elusimicrobiota bacterium]
METAETPGRPHPLVILAAAVAAAAVATFVLPGGQYQRVDMNGRLVAVAGSFRSVPRQPQGLAALALAPFNGLLEAADVIALLFILGGALAVVKETGALSAGIRRAARLLKGREAVMVPALMALFALGGAVFGMYEGVLPLVGVVVPLAVAMGYDSIVGVSACYLAAALGFCGAFLNPFTLGVAQEAAGLPRFSGMGYRLVVWTVMVGTGIAYVMAYAARVKRDPKSSGAYESDEAIRRGLQADDPAPGAQAQGSDLTARHKAVLALLAAGLAVLPVGVVHHGWGVKELAGLSFALGAACGLVGIGTLGATAEAFVAGCRGMAAAALLVGVARGVRIMLDSGLVMDTILHGLAAAVSSFPKVVAVQVMFLAQCVVSMLIPPGAAQAAASMPVMAPLADHLGVTRQTAVLAYQLGDGLTAFAVPWNGATLAALSLGLVPIWPWFKWAWKLQAVLVAVCMALLLWPTLAGWGPG